MKSKDLRTNQSVLPSLHECQIPRRSLKHNNFSNPHLQRRNPDHVQQPAFCRHNSASEDKHRDASQATNQQRQTGHISQTWLRHEGRLIHTPQRAFGYFIPACFQYQTCLSPPCYSLLNLLYYALMEEDAHLF